MLLAWLGLVAGCGMPHDPEGTRQRVEGGTLRVGIIEHRPWAWLDEAGSGAGVEPGLVRELASELEARVAWTGGPAHELLAAVRKHQLDLVIGGLPRDTPWRREVGLSTAYIEMPVVLSESAAPSPSPTGDTIDPIEGRRIGVPRGRPIGAMVEEAGGVPVTQSAEALADFDGPIAAPRWQVTAAGREPGREVLARRKHVWAVPPGENGWLVRVDAFLSEHGQQVLGRLVRAAKTGTGQ